MAANVTPIFAGNYSLQSYTSQDESLLLTANVNTVLTGSSKIELHLYSPDNVLLESNLDFSNYGTPISINSSGPNNLGAISLNPEKDLDLLGYDQGEFIAYYAFTNLEIGSATQVLYVDEISSDRTEVRIKTNGLSALQFVEQAENFIEKRELSNYFIDFYLNFFGNNLTISNNIKLEDKETSTPSIVVKLYEPLPPEFEVKNFVYVITQFDEPVAYRVKFQEPELESIQFTYMKGPNFAIPIKSEVNNSSQNLSYTDIISSAPTSSQNQIESLLEETSINISVDYDNYLDFIHFSSVQTRIENFYYKVGLIETYTNQFNSLINVTGSSSSRLIFEQKTSNVIKNFDQFEYFMYYSSGSINSYPKSNTDPTYILYPTTSSQVLTWLGSTNENSSNYGGLLLSASNYDNENPDQLLKAIPEYLREDPANQQYDLFVDMVAQYYDNVWLYTKDITQKYNADNRLDFGVSKDLVSDAIKDFGLKLYQNNFSNQELYTAFLGLTPGGSTFPFPEITGSMPVPTGFEFVDTLISASNDVISMDDTNKSLYKRIYHNIPYLLKSKGTITGLRALITSYGIPDTILRISEFGGKDQVNANDYDLYQNNFNYKINTDEGATIQTPFSLNPKWDKYGGTGWYGSTPAPETVEFRFKTDGITSAAAVNDQVIWSLEGSNALMVLEYTGSGFTSGSYDGSIADPYNEYATLKFYPNFSGTKPSASVYLPFFDGGWWSVAFTLDNPTNVSSQATLYAGNKIYNGADGTSIGYFASSSLNTTANPTSLIGGLSNFPVESSTPDGGWNASWGCFTGSYQEIRYYNTNITENQFKDYVMNPLSFEGNSINGAPDQLAFRASLGSDLVKANSLGSIPPKSIHPKVTGSWALTSSFTSDSNFTLNPGTSGSSALYSNNTEIFFLDQPAAGIKNRITDKIRSESDTLASGSVLSPIESLSQNIEASASYTPNVNYLEVAFSPQNQINDDIIGQMGHFNIGDYIGDPAQRFTGNNYPDLNNLSEEYFKKYIQQYDLVDFVRLIKFFDNSLFKMIKDFIPVRTSLASGLVVKQHLLERNKYPQPQISREEILLTGSINIVSISGGAAGVFNEFNSTTTSPLGSLGQGPNNNFSITQSWSVTTPSVSGSVTKIHDSQDEFYNGELSGSRIEVTNGELNPHCEKFKNPAFVGVNYKVRTYSDTITGQELTKFIDPDNHPINGYISTWYGDTPNNPLASPADSNTSSS